MQESQDSQAEHSWTFSLFSRNDSPKLLRSLISRPSSTSTASQSMSVAECGSSSAVAAVGGESSTTVAAIGEKQPPPPPPPPQRSHVGTFRKISFTRRSRLRKAMDDSGSTAAAQNSAIGIRRDFCSAAAADSCDLLDVGTSANSAAAAANKQPQQSPKEQPQPPQDTEAVLASAASTAVASTASTAVGAASAENKAVEQKENVEQQKEAENEEPASRLASSVCEKKHSVGGGTSGRTSSSKSARSSRRERERDCVISRDADSAFERGSGPMVLTTAAGNKRGARKLQRTSSSETEKSASRKSVGSNKKGKPALQAIHSGEQVLRPR